jgi:hypothetical protein
MQEDTVRACDSHGSEGSDASLPSSCNQVVADAIVQENKVSVSAVYSLEECFRSCIT